MTQRLVTFTFRLTKAERRTLNKLARSSRLKTTAEYVRRAALGNARASAESAQSDGAARTAPQDRDEAGVGASAST